MPETRRHFLLVIIALIVVAVAVVLVPEVSGVVVALAEGRKCERCWQVLPEVGTHADHPDLCHRCHDAVVKGRKVVA